MKKIIAIMALALGLAACGGSEKAPTTYINIGTGGTAGTYYPLGGAFAEIWNTNIDGVNATAESSVANVNMLQKGDIDVAIIQNDVASYAENGVELFENKVDNIRGMATLYSEPIQCITTDGSVKTIADLKGKKVAVMLGFTGDVVVSEMEDVKVERFNAAYAGIMALQNGKVDAVVLDSETANNYVAKNSGLKLAEGKGEAEDYAIAVKKSDAKLLEEINAAIDQIKADGTFGKIIEKHFN